MPGFMFMKQNSSQYQSKGTFIKIWRHHLKDLKRSTVKLKNAMLVSPDGRIISHNGEETITKNDILTLRDILLHQPGCREVLHLDNLYYCVKSLTEEIIVLFNGSNYLIACVTNSEHLLFVNIKAKKLDSNAVTEWIQDVADEL